MCVCVYARECVCVCALARAAYAEHKHVVLTQARSHLLSSLYASARSPRACARPAEDASHALGSGMHTRTSE